VVAEAEAKVEDRRDDKVEGAEDPRPRGDDLLAVGEAEGVCGRHLLFVLELAALREGHQREVEELVELLRVDTRKEGEGGGREDVRSSCSVLDN
jgi:hypothetical protein